MGNTFCVFCGCVDQANIGVVESWGRFQKLAQPGFHFFNPFAGECLAGVLSTRISSLDVRIETKTKDNVFVQLLCSIQYRVIKENADDAFYELQNPKEQIQAYVFDVVRAHVPRMTLDELFEQKGDVAQAVLEELEKFECLADRWQTSKSATYIANRPTIRKNQGRIMTMSSLQSTPLLHMLEQVMGLGRRMAWIFCVEYDSSSNV